MSGSHYLGIEIGGTKLQVCVGDGAGQIKECIRFEVDKTAGAQGIRDHLAKTLPTLVSMVKPRAIGVGFGGPVDWTNGRICCSHQIGGWSDFPLADWLEQLSGLPVIVDNDANTGALGEALHGADAKHRIVFYVTLGSGVGGGLVVNGNIYHGAKPGESEIGHIRLDRSGTLVENRCSGWAVDMCIREAVKKNPKSSLAQCVGSTTGNEARHLAAALALDDSLAQSILNATADDLAFGLSHVMHLFHPDVIVLGGGLSLVGEPLRAQVASSLKPYLMEAFGAGPKVLLSELRENAVPTGALALAARREHQ